MSPVLFQSGINSPQECLRFQNAVAKYPFHRAVLGMKREYQLYLCSESLGAPYGLFSTGKLVLKNLGDSIIVEQIL